MATSISYFDDDGAPQLGVLKCYYFSNGPGHRCGHARDAWFIVVVVCAVPKCATRVVVLLLRAHQMMANAESVKQTLLTG